MGGGFGGVKAALELAGDDRFKVAVISDRGAFRYYPALYQAAAGGRQNASTISLREIFKDKNVRLVRDTAKLLDRDKKIVTSASGKKYEYDELIIALGSVPNHFGIAGIEKYAYGINSFEEAKRLRTHLHKQMLDDGRPDLSYIVVGGGPTGVEVAGTLPDYLARVMKRHGIKKQSLHIDLVEAAPRLLPKMPSSFSRAVTRRLRKMGVKLHLDQAVKAEKANSLVLEDHSIESHTVIWTAGLTINPFFAANDFNLSVRGRIAVDKHLRAGDFVHVIGDNADTKYSGLAQTALYDAKFVAGNLKRLYGGSYQKNYRPKRPIYVVPVGTAWAAVAWGSLQMHGLLGWMLRRVADFAGYSDYEPWWKAGQRWVAQTMADEEDCPTCK